MIGQFLCMKASKHIEEIKEKHQTYIIFIIFTFQFTYSYLKILFLYVPYLNIQLFQRLVSYLFRMKFHSIFEYSTFMSYFSFLYRKARVTGFSVPISMSYCIIFVHVPLECSVKSVDWPMPSVAMQFSLGCVFLSTDK